MIQVQDTTGTLSAADLAALRTHQAGLSYRILVTAAGSRAELDAAAGRLVTSSDGIGGGGFDSGGGGFDGGGGGGDF